MRSVRLPSLNVRKRLKCVCNCEKVPDCKVGLIGTGTMGHNMARNITRHNIPLAVKSRKFSNTVDIIKDDGFEYIYGFDNMKEFVSNIERPRTILLMIPSGVITDSVLYDLYTHLDKRDSIIDCGNEWYLNTERRMAEAEINHLYYIGMGVSGGWRGALLGPSIMPSGSIESFERNEWLLRKICANPSKLYHIGRGGSGQFVKMVHNGIEYAIMQCISEVYDYMRNMGMSNEEMMNVFADWNRDIGDTYLLRITSTILGDDIIDKISDEAMSNGTGCWTVRCAMELNVPVPSISAAVEARSMSSTTVRKQLKLFYEGFDETEPVKKLDESELIELKQTLHASFVMCYIQGLVLIRAMSDKKDWGVNIYEVLETWTEGSIIQSEIIYLFFMKNGTDEHIMFNHYVKQLFVRFYKAMKSISMSAMDMGVSMPSVNASIEYLRMVTNDNLPMNIIQAQRNYFGHHPICLKDSPQIINKKWD